MNNEKIEEIIKFFKEKYDVDFRNMIEKIYNYNDNYRNFIKYLKTFFNEESYYLCSIFDTKDLNIELNVYLPFFTNKLRVIFKVEGDIVKCKNIYLEDFDSDKVVLNINYTRTYNSIIEKEEREEMIEELTHIICKLKGEENE